MNQRRRDYDRQEEFNKFQMDTMVDVALDAAHERKIAGVMHLEMLESVIEKLTELEQIPRVRAGEMEFEPYEQIVHHWPERLDRDAEEEELPGIMTDVQAKIHATSQPIRKLMAERTELDQKFGAMIGRWLQLKDVYAGLPGMDDFQFELAVEELVPADPNELNDFCIFNNRQNGSSSDTSDFDDAETSDPVPVVPRLLRNMHHGAKILLEVYLPRLAQIEAQDEQRMTKICKLLFKMDELSRILGIEEYSDEDEPVERDEKRNETDTSSAETDSDETDDEDAISLDSDDSDDADSGNLNDEFDA